MQAAPQPDDERERLRALLRYDVLDTAAEEVFDELTGLASQICGVPIALVSLVDEHRQWFKSRVGLDAAETPRELAFCAHAILQDEVFEVPNALADPRFADNPLVAGAPDIRFYAGMPLVTNDGFKLGTLCVIDRIPRQLSVEQRNALRILGRQVITQLELRKAATHLARSLQDLQAARGTAGSVLVEEPVWQDSRQVQRAFLARVTHDLRTPLNAILGFSDLLSEDAVVDADERREIAGNIHRAGGYMLRLVNDILDVSRLESGTAVFARVAFDLNALARATIDTIRLLALANGNHIDFVDTRARHTITGDPTQVQKSLFNLLSNAVKYTRDGMIRLTIADDTDHKIRIEVADTGIGMTAEQRLRLFRPFAQVHNAKVKNTESTGLGLHITRVLCEQMGGAITVRSEAGVGSTFTVWLAGEPPPGPPGPHGQQIAVAEGDPDVRAALQLAIGSMASLVYFEGVAELLWTLVDRRWRAVIVDATAPGAEEIELLRAVARNCREADTKMVVATMKTERPDLQELPQWRIDDAPAALQALLEQAAPLVTPSPLR